MSPFPQTRNRLLLALPRREFERLKPALQHVQCSRAQVLVDADSSLEHVYFPNSGVISIVAVYPDGSIIEMATIGREGPPASKPCLAPRCRPRDFSCSFQAPQCASHARRFNELCTSCPPSML
jgi:hypothetical protein